MLIFKKIPLLQQYIQQQRAKGSSFGFVPTMGALHRGHMSLIQQSNADHHQTVVSIFVNPTQFNEKQDLDKYPRPIEDDIEKLIDAGVDVLFLPDSREIYPDGEAVVTDFDYGTLAHDGEGKARPGHFEGMVTVVKRLLEIVSPQAIYMGQKDYQQYLLVKRLAAFYKLPVKVEMGPTVREHDGLALSSRNVHLSPEERKAAKMLPDTLFAAAEALKNGQQPGQIIRKSVERLKAHPLIQEVEYFDVVDGETMLPLRNNTTKRPAVVYGAVKMQSTRLLDNVLIP